MDNRKVPLFFFLLQVVNTNRTFLISSANDRNIFRQYIYNTQNRMTKKSYLRFGNI
jgi:hypothetical protein